MREGRNWGTKGVTRSVRGLGWVETGGEGKDVEIMEHKGQAKHVVLCSKLCPAQSPKSSCRFSEPPRNLLLCVLRLGRHFLKPVITWLHYTWTLSPQFPGSLD